MTMFEILAPFLRYFETPLARAGAIWVVSLALAMLLRFVIVGIAAVLARKTFTDWDDRLILAVKWPIFWSALLAGTWFAIDELTLSVNGSYVVTGLIKSIAVLMWGKAISHIATLVLEILSRSSEKYSFIKPATLPLLQITVKVLVMGGVAYFAFVAWNIDVTGWLASAGIVGIAVGFAAKDTLANLFAGIFILTDAPYKLGDFVVLRDGQRGMVTHIGIRSTRILTREDVEITIPNAIIANSQIVNESSGPHEKRRLSIVASVAYGSDVDQVREVLLKSIEGLENVCSDPSPIVRFIEMADSGLIFQIRVWIDLPVYKGRVIDAINTRAYKALNAAGIEIPYPKQDVYIRQMVEPPKKSDEE